MDKYYKLPKDLLVRISAIAHRRGLPLEKALKEAINLLDKKDYAQALAGTGPYNLHHKKHGLRLD